MGRSVHWLFRMYLRLIWFLLGVLPGNLLRGVHTTVRAARGRPPAPWPPAVYRVAGFVLTIVCISGVDALLTGSAGLGTR
jgi:hypothetical protein